MSLDRLIKAKKSVSGIFSRMSSPPLPPCSPMRQENDAPSYETPDPSSAGSSSTVPDASDESPTKDTSSIRKGLMGSLRKQKLRSISSLRSLRSPTKTKQSDAPASPLAENPCTPKQRLNSSLVLNFEESPPDQPIFDLDCKDSTTSSLRVHRSSPVPVPSSEKQNALSLVDSSLIPFGTVPLSPAPIQRLLELDQTGTPPSPTSIPAYDPNSETMRRPGSTKNALSDCLQDAAAYLNKPVASYEDLELSDLLPEKCYTHLNESEDLRRKLRREEQPWVHGVENSSDHKINDEQDRIQGIAIDKVSDAANVNRTAEEHAKVILGKGYYARAYRRADGQCRLKIKLLASDPEDRDDDPKWDNKTPFRFPGPQEDRLVSELGAIIRRIEIVSTCDEKIDEALTAGKLPAYLDVALDDDSTKNAQSLIHNPAKVRKRDSTWGQHTGLYDGSGYGAGSSSRPMTVVTETTDMPRAHISRAFSGHENEAPMIIRRLWDTTYPPGLDMDFRGQAPVGDAATCEAQEQSESHFKDYRALQDKLGSGGNAKIID